MATWKTTAAARFIEDVKVGWDSFEPWEATAKNGLAEVDEDALRSFCDENDEDYSTAEREVLEYIRAKVDTQKEERSESAGA